MWFKLRDDEAIRTDVVTWLLFLVPRDRKRKLELNGLELLRGPCSSGNAERGLGLY